MTGRTHSVVRARAVETAYVATSAVTCVATAAVGTRGVDSTIATGDRR